jgi:class 3 adenylate cyclase
MLIAQADMLPSTEIYTYLGWAIALLLGVITLARQRTIRRLKEQQQQLREEKAKSDYWLSNMLPSEVVRQLKNDKIAGAQAYDNTCILFTDFQGFSQIAEQLSPRDLVTELNAYFSHFDRIIEKHRLQKIKTIGDAYMCVGGLYTKGTKHVQRMIVAALEMQAFLEHHSQQQTDRPLLNARIGIHTGAIVAGVIGTNQIAFDVWGNAVNVAQQMEQHAEVGTVNISDATYELVKNHFACTLRGTIQLKNGKSCKMYKVDGML